MNVLALTGPPCAGKSTIVSILEDLNVPCKDTGDAIRDEAHRRYDDPDEDMIWEVAGSIRDEHGNAGPTKMAAPWIDEQDSNLVCISSLRDQAEVEWLRDNVGPTLTLRIEASQYSRCERYVNLKLSDDEKRGSITRERVLELHKECVDREERESPYPDHDCIIRNEDSVSMRDLYEKLDHIVSVAKL